MSEYLRRAKLHEFGHIKKQHWGTYTQDCPEWKPGDRFLSHVRGKNEREAETIAAYLAISKRALRALQGCDSHYVAAVLDVPECLVATRRTILKQYKR